MLQIPVFKKYWITQFNPTSYLKKKMKPRVYVTANLHICNVLLRSTSVGVRTVIHTISICYFVFFRFYYVTIEETVVLQDCFNQVWYCILHSIQGVAFEQWSLKVLKLPYKPWIRGPCLYTGLFFMEDLLSCSKQSYCLLFEVPKWQFIQSLLPLTVPHIA